MTNEHRQLKDLFICTDPAKKTKIAPTAMCCESEKQWTHL